MILVDTSVWIDHLRGQDKDLTRLLNLGRILTHPFVSGELALGSLANRGAVLSALNGLPQAPLATDQEVQQLITGLQNYLAPESATSTRTYWQLHA